jgi:hypothetical protein
MTTKGVNIQLPSGGQFSLAVDMRLQPETRHPARDTRTMVAETLASKPPKRSSGFTSITEVNPPLA